MRGQRLLDNAPCQAVAGLDSGALLLPRHRASLVQTKADRHANGSPSGGAGERSETERARLLTENHRHRDSIALTKSLPIAAPVALSCRACPLRHCSAMPPLPEGEALAGRFTSYWTTEARQDAKGRALLAGTAASGQRSLSSCRWPRQRSTAASETSCFARPDES